MKIETWENANPHCFQQVSSVWHTQTLLSYYILVFYSSYLKDDIIKLPMRSIQEKVFLNLKSSIKHKQWHILCSVLIHASKCNRLSKKKTQQNKKDFLDFEVWALHSKLEMNHEGPVTIFWLNTHKVRTLKKETYTDSLFTIRCIKCIKKMGWIFISSAFNLYSMRSNSH